MYRSFFGLRERPFDLTPNPRFVVLTDGHREALSNLEYGISGRRGITLLIGEAGTGKTTLIRAALQRQPDVVRSVYLHNPALTREEFVEMLAVRFALSPAARASKTLLLTELETVLRDRHERGESTVLIVDEAQSLPLGLLEEIRLLGNIETDDSKLLSIVLAGQPELATKLNLNPLRQLKQRIALRCELKPLTQSESAGYLSGRIRAAGGIGAQVFTREAVILMHEIARGIPRTLSVIADNALVSAFALGQQPVTSQIVAEVCRDFDLSAALQEPAETSQFLDAPMTEPSNQQSEAPANTVASSPSRVLAFDLGAPPPLSASPSPAVVSQGPPANPSQRHVPTGASQPPAAARGAVPEKRPDTNDEAAHRGMFNSIYPKRRRFSLFRNVGSR